MGIKPLCELLYGPIFAIYSHLKTVKKTEKLMLRETEFQKKNDYKAIIGLKQT